jgi:hypothetical protein
MVAVPKPKRCGHAHAPASIEFQCDLGPATSDAHGHEDVAVFVVVYWADLAGGLGIFELQPDFADIADGFQQIDHAGKIESAHQWIIEDARHHPVPIPCRSHCLTSKMRYYVPSAAL